MTITSMMAQESGTAAPQTILVADDHSEDVDELIKSLNAAGYHVVYVSNSKDACSRIVEGGLAAVILDGFMPPENGSKAQRQGDEIARFARAKDPGLVIAIRSAEPRKFANMVEGVPVYHKDYDDNGLLAYLQGKLAKTPAEDWIS